MFDPDELGFDDEKPNSPWFIGALIVGLIALMGLFVWMVF